MDYITRTELKRLISLNHSIAIELESLATDLNVIDTKAVAINTGYIIAKAETIISQLNNL